jgi:hypothetical protein
MMMKEIEARVVKVIGKTIATTTPPVNAVFVVWAAGFGDMVDDRRTLKGCVLFGPPGVDPDGF